VFDEPPGSYDICPICFWEDDALQLEFATTLAGGANRPTLVQAQQNVAVHGASEPRLVTHVRAPGPNDSRDPKWRPIDIARDQFEDWHAPNRFRAPGTDPTLYYWSDQYWRIGLVNHR
jgi:hypothetical protein